MSNDAYAVLWTGGWDSTYRVLDLVVVQKKAVQPYYLDISQRRSSRFEIQAMEKIRSMVLTSDPSSEGRFATPIIVAKDQLVPDASIAQSLASLKAKSAIGDQYEWLAQLAAQCGVHRLELSVHVDDKAYDHLKDNVHLQDGTYILVDKPSPPELEIFRRFSFPVLKLTKLEMAEKMNVAGLGPLMEETWFCHRPDKRGRPCGRCAPCAYTMEEGLARRIPLVNRTVWGTARKVKSMLRSLRGRMH